MRSAKQAALAVIRALFCIREADRIDGWRVLHARRDIPNLLRRPEPDEEA
jgi:hypothetical protein